MCVSLCVCTEWLMHPGCLQRPKAFFNLYLCFILPQLSLLCLCVCFQHHPPTHPFPLCPLRPSLLSMRKDERPFQKYLCLLLYITISLSLLSLSPAFSYPLVLRMPSYPTQTHMHTMNHAGRLEQLSVFSQYNRTQAVPKGPEQTRMMPWRHAHLSLSLSPSADSSPSPPPTPFLKSSFHIPLPTAL